MTTLEENITNNLLTLGNVMADGPLPVPEALRYSMMLAEMLRRIHDSGRTVAPCHRPNTYPDAGLELEDTTSKPAIVTRYTAPEILQGHAPNSRSDIFAFGAIVYEMVTGRPAFAGDNADALAVSLTISLPAPSGIPDIDRLVQNCIAKDPAARCQRMQRVILELKLLTLPPIAEGASRRQTARAALRAQNQQLEARVAALGKTQAEAMDVQRSSCEAIDELRVRMSKVESELAPVQARTTLIEELCQRIMAQLEQVQQNIVAIDERVTGLKNGIDNLSEGAVVLREYVGTRTQDLDQALKSQTSAIAAVVTSQAQTDDVLEGVVRAMGLLHTMVLDRDEELVEA